MATEKELALAVGCAQSTMHDLLNSEDARYSSLVPDVHRVFGWSPPNPPEAMPPVFSPDALEMAAMYDQLPENVRELMRAQAKSFIDLASKVKTTP